MNCKHLVRSGLALALVLLGGLAFTEDAAATHPVQVCPAPVSICGPTAAPLPPCPPGHSCVCVPSCPDCNDCATFVCVASGPECRTACDCDKGLGCSDGRCIAHFAPVFCCERDGCTEFGTCQSESGEFKRCGDQGCDAPQVWLCPETTGDLSGVIGGCGEGRECSCTASCQFCEDCGPGVCVPKGTPTPYRCESDTDCVDGDSCECVSSCPECDDCTGSVCVPKQCDDPQCELRLRKSQYKLKRAIRRASRCESDDHCVHVSTDTQCQGTCGAFVNRMYLDPVQRIVARIDHRICDGYYSEDDCPYSTPGCVEQRGICRRGRCRGTNVDF